MGKNRVRSFLGVVFTVVLCACPVNTLQFPVMVPGQIAGAFGQGASALPYLVYSKTDLKKIDEACKTTSIGVSLEDTYRAAYGKKLEDVLPSGETGQAFHTMQEASLYLQKVLKDKGEPRAGDYIFTSLNTAGDKGYILLAVVRRPRQAITVTDKYEQGPQRNLTPKDLRFFRAYQYDTDKNRLDGIVDWAGIPNDCLSSQSAQAILLTITANKILGRETKEGYWSAEELWAGGHYLKVMDAQDEKTCVACGYKDGFFSR
ncbi:MAG: hypothetical protein ABFD70_09035 [Syntrophaceae bacterium]|nr:hypothetical protein [Deltaproteobacteria bacterium]